MGSRAIAVIARDGDAAERRFGVGDGTTGTVYTRRQRAEATQWWLDLTTAGREGIVVKPADLIEGRVQPGLKVRGREYLRIIYGPDTPIRWTSCVTDRPARSAGSPRWSTASV